MRAKRVQTDGTSTHYFVDEAGDGVLFGHRGRNRLEDADASRFFMLGMVECEDHHLVADTLDQLRQAFLRDNLYSSIPSMRPSASKTARAFHAKDDHPEIRARVFETIRTLEFKLHVVVRDMRQVAEYVRRRKAMEASYRYTPLELYDYTVRTLFKQRIHKSAIYRVTFARRGNSDRTDALLKQLERARASFLARVGQGRESTLQVEASYPWEEPCLQVVDYGLWAVQRCYERGEDRFLRAIWPKVSLLHDMDDTSVRPYGTYLTRDHAPPDPSEIKIRRI